VKLCHVQPTVGPSLVFGDPLPHPDLEQATKLIVSQYEQNLPVYNTIPFCSSPINRFTAERHCVIQNAIYRLATHLELLEWKRPLYCCHGSITVLVNGHGGHYKEKHGI